MRSLGFVIAVIFIASVSMASAKVKVNEPFPNFSLKKLGAPAQDSLAKYKGKVVVVDFWASWCEPCKKEIPALNNIYKKWQKKGVVVLGVNVDDQESTAKDFVKETKAAFPVLYDAGKKLANECDLTTMPSSFVIDKQGNVRYIHSGYKEGDAEKFEKEIKSVL